MTGRISNFHVEPNVSTAHKTKTILSNNLFSVVKAATKHKTSEGVRQNCKRVDDDKRTPQKTKTKKSPRAHKRRRRNPFATNGSLLHCCLPDAP
jgi:hypothetical protein